MTISLIVPILNAEKTIDECLEHIRVQRRQPDEIILVDNASTDSTLARIDAFRRAHLELPIQLLHEERRGAAAARNRGIAAAAGEIIAFTDSDVFAAPDWLASLAEIFGARVDIDGVGGIARIRHPRTIAAKLQALNLFLPDPLRDQFVATKHEILFGRTMPTMNASYRRRVFEAVGGFDECLSVAGEDLDFQIRAFERGHKLLTGYSAARIDHAPRESFRQFMAQIFAYRVAVPALIRKHFAGQAVVQLGTSRIMAWPCPMSIVLTRRALTMPPVLVVIAAAFAMLGTAAGMLTLLSTAMLLFLRSVAATLRHARDAGVSVSATDAVLLTCLGRVQSVVTILGRGRGSLGNGVFYL